MTALPITPDEETAYYVEWVDPTGERFAWRTQPEVERDLIAAHWMAERAEERGHLLMGIMVACGLSAPIWFAIGWAGRQAWLFVARLIGGA